MRLITSAALVQKLNYNLPIQPASAANLPTSNGADLSKTGTVETLTPIVIFERSLIDAKFLLNSKNVERNLDVLSPETIVQLASTLKNIPAEERQFKKIFDEYSDPVSYKQKYMDQNAFLVYYTKGFDGPGRDSIESGELPRQALQYGARNECWTAIEELFSEIEFAMKEKSSSLNDISDPLSRALVSFDAYLKIAPTDDLEKAKVLAKR